MMETTDARGFAVDINRTYDEKSELKHLCSHSYYDGEEAEFFQIGRHVKVPADLVETGRYRYITDGVVGALCEGEKSFVAEHLAELAEDGVPSGKGTRPLDKAVRSVEDADTVLVPRSDAGDETVARWEDEGRLRRLGEGTYVTHGDSNEAGCWVRRHDADAALIVDTERVSVVQKRTDDTESPAFSEGYAPEDGDGNNVGVYFGNITHADDGFVDVVYRVVVSAPVVEDGGVCRLLL